MAVEARALDRDAAREIANAERAIVGARGRRCSRPASAAITRCSATPVFDCVIVDEATQAPDPLLLDRARAARKVAVLAGDPQQLGPVVIGGPQRRGDRSARRCSSGSSRGRAAVMLEQQHRMHEQIMTFPSRSMYDGPAARRARGRGAPLDDLGVAAGSAARPRRCGSIDTAGKDWLEQRTDFEPGGSLNNMPAFQFDPSTFNTGNAERVAAEARRLLSRGLAADRRRDHRRVLRAGAAAPRAAPRPSARPGSRSAPSTASRAARRRR